MRKNHPFTLLETMIAATILALAVASTAGIVGGARSTLLRAEQRWQEQHLLTQAVELFLLGGPNAPYIDGVLPDGYSAECSVYAVEDLEEAALEANRGWLLCEYSIRLLSPDGNVVGSTTVRKVLKEEDVE